MELPNTAPLLALTYELKPGLSVVFAYYPDGRFGRGFTEEPKFACRHEVVEFFAAYGKARGEFLEVLSTLLGRRIQAVDEVPGDNTTTKFMGRPRRVH